MTVARLIRDRLTTDGPTMGQLVIDAATFQTLELPWKDNAHNASCIPPGRYPLAMLQSPKFGRRMPVVMEVPNRDGIEIHPGNTMANTTGCVLIGYFRLLGTIPPSLSFGTGQASADLNSWLQAHLALGEEVFLDVSYAN
jgi:hypothetical protein